MSEPSIRTQHDSSRRSTRWRLPGLAGLCVAIASAGPASAQDDEGDDPVWGVNAEIALEYESERNFNLDADDDENEAVVKPEFNLELSYRPTPQFAGFARLELSRDYGVSGPEADTGETALNLAEAYIAREGIAFPGAGELSLTLGRQRFADERQWLYDVQLDGFTLRYDYEDFQVSLSAVRQRNRDLLSDDRGDESDNVIAYGTYEFEDRVVGGYLMEHQERQDGEERTLFTGLQSYGELWDDTDYWIDVAMANGENDDGTIRGWGIDGGLVRSFDAPLSPVLMVGYAFGTGDDDPDDGTDDAFRQTGFQDNEQDLGGQVGLPSLGLLLEPELSNLQVFSVGIGLTPHERVSTQLVFHRYRQHLASSILRDTNLDDDPNGTDRDLGYAVDWALGLEIGEATEIEAVAGYFNPGDAFDDGADDALFLGMEISYEF